MKKVLMVGCVIATAFTAVAMPTNKDLATARPLVEDITSPYIKDLQAGKTTAAEVAKKHMTLAEKAQNEAERYLLLQGAFKLYARGEEYDAAAEALTAMCENVKEVPPELIIEIVNKEMRRVAGEKAPKVLTIFRDAKKVVNCHKDLAEADKLLKSNPRDPNLHKKRGDSLAALGDWKGALAAFRKAGGAVKKMADAEAKGDVPPDEIADFWWDYVAAQPEEYARNFRKHAATLYEKALASGTVTGLSKVQAERRVKEVNGYDESFFDVAKTGNSMYCVIDLSAGANAEKYHVKYMNKPPSGGFNVDEYKTTKLVLRLIKPGSFKMCGKYNVTLTKPFYCGIFEVTQKQYALVTGKYPSQHKGDMRPVERVSWNMIRGDSRKYNWPRVTKVDEDSFIGRLQSRTGLNFDLPTEAQWEYACRAGSTGAFCELSDGAVVTESTLGDAAWYGDNSGRKTHPVGAKKPNAFGLYDMHGNVWEWCQDWYGDYDGNATDPTGPASGSFRVLRGGSWLNSARRCRSANRGGGNPGYRNFNLGFRLACSAGPRGK